MAKYFGSDATGGGIEWQFRTIKAGAKCQKDFYLKGGDPKDLGIGSGKDTNGQNLIIFYQLHVFLLFSTAQHDWYMFGKQTFDVATDIALRMNDGTTAYALQHRFRDIKKQAQEMNSGQA